MTRTYNQWLNDNVFPVIKNATKRIQNKRR